MKRELIRSQRRLSAGLVALACIAPSAACGWDDIIPHSKGEPIPPDAPTVVLDAPRGETCNGWTQDGWPCETNEAGWTCSWSEGHDAGAPVPAFTCSCDGQTWHCVEQPYVCGMPHDGWSCTEAEKDQMCHWGEGTPDAGPIPIFDCLCDGRTWHCTEVGQGP